MKKRSLEYEKKFRKYLFSFDFDTHKEICKQINVKPKLSWGRKMKKRSLEYEKKFRKYLFSFDFDTHKEICKQINVKPKYEEGGR